MMYWKEVEYDVVFSQVIVVSDGQRTVKDV